jgi:AcrR family transcriptional regulator
MSRIEKKPLVAEVKKGQKKPADSKERILAVSTKQFADRGFEGVVIRDIAKAADVTLPTIYHFFGDKRKLYERTCIEIFEKKNALLEAALQSSDNPAVRLWSFTSKLLSILIEDNDFTRLLQRELVERDYLLIDDTVRSSLQPHFRMLSTAVADLTNKQDEFDRSISIYSLAFGLAALRPVWQVVNGKRRPKLKTPAETAVLVLGLVFPGIQWETFGK